MASNVEASTTGFMGQVGEHSDVPACSRPGQRSTDKAVGVGQPSASLAVGESVLLSVALLELVNASAGVGAFLQRCAQPSPAP